MVVFGLICVDEDDTSDKNYRGFDAGVASCLPAHKGRRSRRVLWDRRESSRGGKEGGDGKGVMLCQRALLERTSSAGNEPNRANFGTRRWRLRRVLVVVVVGGPSGKMMIN